MWLSSIQSGDPSRTEVSPAYEGPIYEKFTVLRNDKVEYDHGEDN